MKKITYKTIKTEITLSREDFKKAIGLPTKFRIIDFCMEDDDLYNLGNSCFLQVEAVKMRKEELKERKDYLFKMENDA